MSTLRSATIRLANENPDLREHLLPLLTDKQAATAIDPMLRNLVEQFRDQVEATVSAEYQTKYPNQHQPAISLVWGPRYVKIVKSDVNQKLVFGFIDLANGDILKPASWSTPAKGARGNLYQAESWKKSFGVYGVGQR